MATKVAIQGIAASFHDEAAKKYFGNEIEIIECNSFKNAALTLSLGKSDYCIMAIENSIAGSILPNYSLINDLHLRITGEIFLPIQLHLMALPGTKLEEIKTIQSHPMAIRQCENFLQTLSGVNIIELNDTAACARLVAEKQLNNTAAIASFYAAKQYNLGIIVPNIETNKENYTRFLILGKERSKLLENNKASLCFQLSSEVGSLFNVLSKFKEHNINITKIQSIPIPSQPYEYTFHLDVEFERAEYFQNAMAEIWDKVSKLSVLGEYKSAGINLN